MNDPTNAAVPLWPTMGRTDENRRIECHTGDLPNDRTTERPTNQQREREREREREKRSHCKTKHQEKHFHYPRDSLATQRLHIPTCPHGHRHATAAKYSTDAPETNTINSDSFCSVESKNVGRPPLRLPREILRSVITCWSIRFSINQTIIKRRFPPQSLDCSVCIRVGMETQLRNPETRFRLFVTRNTERSLSSGTAAPKRKRFPESEGKEKEKRKEKLRPPPSPSESSAMAAAGARARAARRRGRNPGRSS